MLVKQATEYIKKNEGKVMVNGRHFAYDDACGKPCKSGDNIKGLVTIGYGRNVMGRGLSEEEALYLLQNDIDEVIKELSVDYLWFNSLSDNRKMAMIDLRFNMGANKLMTFKNFLRAMSVSDWNTASNELMDSAYAKQVGSRASRNRDLIIGG